MKIILVSYLLLSLLVVLVAPLAIVNTSVSIKYETEEPFSSSEEIVYLKKIYESELLFYKCFFVYSLINAIVLAGVLSFRKSHDIAYYLRIISILVSCFLLIYVLYGIFANEMNIHSGIPNLNVSESDKGYLLMKAAYLRKALAICGLYGLGGMIIVSLSRVSGKLIQVKQIRMLAVADAFCQILANVTTNDGSIC